MDTITITFTREDAQRNTITLPREDAQRITITLTREDAQRICNALITETVKLSEQSKTIGVDCLHPDSWHREWNEATALWMKVYNAIHPETEKED